jgi:hypothetical protein
MAQHLTFINQSITHRRSSSRDLSTINAHIAQVSRKRKSASRIDVCETFDPPSQAVVPAKRNSFCSAKIPARSGKRPIKTDNDDKADAPDASEQFLLNIGSFSLSDVHIGGFRDDPFNMFPIATTPVVTRAFDYCKKTGSKCMRHTD